MRQSLESKSQADLLILEMRLASCVPLRPAMMLDMEKPLGNDGKFQSGCLHLVLMEFAILADANAHDISRRQYTPLEVKTSFECRCFRSQSSYRGEQNIHAAVTPPYMHYPTCI